jgi:RNA-directed DNA polymerase
LGEWRQFQALRLARLGWKHCDIAEALGISEGAVSSIDGSALQAARGQRSRLTWHRLGKLADFWVPKPKILHPYPNARFDAKTRSGSRMR